MKKTIICSSRKKKLVFQIKVANKNIRIECMCRHTYSMCLGYLSLFENPDISISISQNEIDSGREVIAMRPSFAPRSIITDSDLSIEEELVLQKLGDAMCSFDTFLIHGAVIARNDNAYLFTASSGIGKTTRAQLWLNEYPDSFIVNGDKPFIQLTNNEAIVYGSPWCGKENWNANTKVPLRAVFLLERADEDGNNSIEEISIGKAFPKLIEQVHRPTDPDKMRKTIQLLKSLDGKVKFYKFHSTPTPEAIRLAYETARPR